MGTTPAGTGLRLDDLCTRPVYFGYAIQNAVVDLIANWLVELRFSYNRAYAIRTLNTLLLIDESHLFFHEETIAQTASLGSTFPLLREFGIGVVLTANHYRGLPAMVRANIGTHVVMNLSDGGDARELARTIGIKSEQELTGALRMGECLIKVPDWPHVIRARFDPLTVDKTVPQSTWQAAIARTNSLGRTAAARTGVAGQPTAPQTSAPSSSASHANAGPLLTTQVALNTYADALLKYVAKHGVVLTTDAYRDLDLHPQAGTRAEKQLLDLALIEEERITIRRGRGGTAVAIRPTAAGYGRAGIKRHGTRGGDSIQHEYLVRTLAARITNARIEARAGTKACDVLIPYNEDTHGTIAKLLGITPIEGGIIAIEVEVSDPQRSAPRNIARNDDAGIAHTIIATMTPLRRTPPGAIVVDIFALLEAL